MTLGQPLHRPVDAGETPASGQDGASRIKAIGPRAPALRWGPISRIVQGGMCGILACYRRDPGASPEVVDRNRRLVLRVSKILRHRGPDGNAINIINKDGVYMAHERLIVVDITENGRRAGRGARLVGRLGSPGAPIERTRRWSSALREREPRG